MRIDLIFSKEHVSMDQPVRNLSFLYRHFELSIDHIIAIKIKTRRLIFNYIAIDVMCTCGSVR